MPAEIFIKKGKKINFELKLISRLFTSFLLKENYISQSVRTNERILLNSFMDLFSIYQHCKLFLSVCCNLVERENELMLFMSSQNEDYFFRFATINDSPSKYSIEFPFYDLI